MAWALDDLPEFNKLVELDLPVTIEINSVEKLICRYFAEADLSPVFLSLDSVDGLVAVLVEDLEDVLHYLADLRSQLLHTIRYYFLSTQGLKLKIA